MPNDRIQPPEEGLFSFFAIPRVFQRGNALTFFVQGDKVAREVLALAVCRHPLPEKALVTRVLLGGFAEV
jgi:hypothetical protein